jgi:hypothetical protein
LAPSPVLRHEVHHVQSGRSHQRFMW